MHRHSILLGIFLTQGLNWCLLHWHADFLPLSYQRSPFYVIESENESVSHSLWPHVWLSLTPLTVAHQVPLSMGFPRQGYWSGLPFPSPGNLPDPGIEPMSPAVADGFFYPWATWEAQKHLPYCVVVVCLSVFPTWLQALRAQGPLSRSFHIKHCYVVKKWRPDCSVLDPAGGHIWKHSNDQSEGAQTKSSELCSK